MNGPGSIGHDQDLNPQPLHDPHRQGHLLHGVAFIIMDAPLHRQDCLAFQLAYHQLPGMTLDRGQRPIR